jgi:hypothetical protein
LDILSQESHYEWRHQALRGISGRLGEIFYGIKRGAVPKVYESDAWHEVKGD